MTRQEILAVAKPILFNTPMVQAAHIDPLAAIAIYWQTLLSPRG